ncbi:MAG TPA: hypothetical protein PKO46_21000 [Sedimentisphaerales bacterium]|nr:hypothetical protein [Sedimentisphaerales bacterium]
MLVLPDRARPIRLVDRSKGIARGLVCASLFNQPGGAYDLMNGGRFDGTAGVGGLVAPSISSGAWHNKTLNGYTVCLWHGGFTFGSWGAVVHSNDGTNRWVWQRYRDSTTISIFHNAGSHDFTGFTTSDCEVPGMLAMRWDGVNAHAFYNGEYLGYSLHANPIGSTVTSTLGFGNATVYQALVYGRVLSDAEICRLYGDPAAPLERSRSRVAVLFLSTGGPQPLAGGIAGQLAVAAALAVSRLLAGQVAAQGALSGQVSVARPLAGSAQVQSSMTGGLSVARPLAGSIQAGSQVDGAAAVERDLSGAVAGQSGLSGTMSVARSLAGSVTAQAQAAGGLSATWAMAGSLEAASAAAGILTIEGQVALAGQLTAASSCAASLSVGRLLAGQVSGQTGLSGSLSLLGEQVALSGSISAQSGVSGVVRVHRGLAGQLVSTPNVSGAMSAMRSLSAQLSGTAQVVGQVRADWALAGSIMAQADVSGRLLILGEVNLAGVFLFLKRKTR